VNKTSRCVVSAVVCVLTCAEFAAAQQTLRVDERAARIQFLADATKVQLPIENSSRAMLPAHLLLELLGTNGQAQVKAESDVSLRPGVNSVALSLPTLLTHGEQTPSKTLLWYRLRYTLTTTGNPVAESRLAEGIIAVGEITPDLFELHVAAPAILKGAAGSCAIRVRAIHPVTGRPVEGVTVQASLDLGTGNGKPVQSKPALTDARGFATLDLTVDRPFDPDDAGLTVKGRKGIGSAEAESDDFHQGYAGHASLTTDKPLYQPGQTLHMRLLAFGPDRKALSGEAATIEIKDPEQTLVQRTEVRTSRFGVASADWQIPENFRLGDYEIEADFDGDQYGLLDVGTSVQISRYDLPTFSVSVKPDRAYYLPGQEAAVEVRANYLYGEPVKHGRVRVVRETDRKWNFREQEWDIQEAEVYQGDADDQGSYTAHIDLSKAQSELAADDYERFRDLTLAAYFTDSSTGKTEQRRFSLRLTKDRIHIYVISGESGQVTGLPLQFYISTDYADGSPAQCDVDISRGGEPATGGEAGNSPAPHQFLVRVHTNRYGVAKVNAPGFVSTGSAGDHELRFMARDGKGSTGNHTETFYSYYYADHSGIRVTADKALYKPGEPILVDLAATDQDAEVVVDAVEDFQTVASTMVHLRHSRAKVTFAATDKYQGEVTISAYELGSAVGEDESSSVPAGSRTVLFPKNRELTVDVHSAKPTYRPGADATVDFQTRGPNDERGRVALGLAVVDEAVDERFRTEQEFGRNSWDSNAWDVVLVDMEGESQQVGDVTRRDLDKLDLDKPLPAGLDLVAEILLRSTGLERNVFSSDSDSEDPKKLFALELYPQLQSLRDALDERYARNGEYPKTAEQLESDLAAAGIHFQDLRDPWGNPFKAKFSADGEYDVVEIGSAGPDKQFGTSDDFAATQLKWPYFKPYSEAIGRAVSDYHGRTGEFIRDLPALKAELARANIDLDSLKDPWGHPYRFSFDVNASQFLVKVTSAGPDGIFGTSSAPSYDDVVLATVGIDYFAEKRAQLDTALANYFARSQIFPENLDQLRTALKVSGIDWDALKDPWGRNYYVTFDTEARYSDRQRIETYEQHEENEHSSTQHTTTVPVTAQVKLIHMRSAGEDGVQGTSDDFEIATFSRVLTEQSSQNPAPVATPGSPVLSGATGAIGGTVQDPAGGVIPNADVRAKNIVTGEVFSAKTEKQGDYLLRNLPAGLYTVTFSAQGFRPGVIVRVPVQSSKVTSLNFTLDVGTVMQMSVTVSANPIAVQTDSNEISSSSANLAGLSLLPKLATPRLREYFPETLLWHPELVTDSQGRAHVSFPLADNITTWKLSVIASNQNGELGTATKEIRAFQPFFVEHDPPRFLTAGDEISLPVVLRNYLDHDLKVSVQMKPEDWFTPLGSMTASANVRSGDSASEVFHFRAVNPIQEGKQEVTAIGAEASDAISRTVTVRPNGEQQTASTSQVFDDAVSLEVRIPDAAIPGSYEATLKIYPNLSAHVFESIEAILERPYGCAEQTISSAYPSVLLLKYAKAAHLEQSADAQRAQHFVQLGYQRLLSYREANGGFSLWGHGNADPVVTAYALKFLGDVSEFVAVDDSVERQAFSWLAATAQSDGHWTGLGWNGNEDAQRSAVITAYIARMLAESKLVSGDSSSDRQTAASASQAVKRALTYLRPLVDSADDAYLIASYALTALDVGDTVSANPSIKRLRSLEHREGDAGYWELETNTAFWGWGLPGRVETTALVLQAFAKAGMASSQDDASRAQVSRGLLFLLHSQDGYGIWYSTQTTINVLDAMAMLTSREDANSSGNPAGQASKATVLVDGKQALTIDLPPADTIAGPVFVDLSRYVMAGIHHVEIRRPAGSARASAQLVAVYYIPWTSAASDHGSHREPNSSEALRLAVQFDKQTASVGENIECSVDAERIGFRGYGMLLAEVGLPPGADVDRSSLEQAVKNSGWEIQSYDVLPDRVVLYLWPRPGGTKFSFTFKPRFGLKALSAPSVLYDYYNPEAQAVVEPVLFSVQ